jgi:SAM-dependent methyltransferase
VERARALAAEQGVGNVRFEAADAYALPFPDAAFDVVNANALLQHLGEPVRALREFRRVLRPGGLAAVTDPDWSTWLIEPATPLLDRLRALRLQVYAHHGGDAGYARHQRRLLLEAGFARAECHVGVRAFGTPQGVEEHVRIFSEQLRAFAPTIARAGLADAATVEAVGEELRAWGERPDATAAFMVFRSIGWADPPGPP